VSGRGRDVVVTSGPGTAPTELAAFDAALQQAGVAHLTLIRLSSHIPPGSRVNVPLKATPDDLAARGAGRLRGATWQIASAVCDVDPVAAVDVAAMRVEPW
jgi:hypothetical protein